MNNKLDLAYSFAYLSEDKETFYVPFCNEKGFRVGAAIYKSNEEVLEAVKNYMDKFNSSLLPSDLEGAFYNEVLLEEAENNLIEVIKKITGSNNPISMKDYNLPEIKGVEEWCPHCTEEVVLPYIEDAKYKEDFACHSCGAILEPDAQKEEPYEPILNEFPERSINSFNNKNGVLYLKGF